MRTRNPLVVLGPDGKPLAGAKVETKLRPSGSLPNVYAAETGSEPAANPGTTDVHGKVNQWLERGAYESLITGLGMEAYAEAWDAAPAGDQGVDHNWLQVTLQTKVDQGTFLPGDLKATASAAIPTGWLRCEGQAVNRTTFAALFAAIGVGYGAGDGTTTFNVPDCRERVVLGSGPSLGIGAKGGEPTVALGLAQIPNHQHPVTPHNHAVATAYTISNFPIGGQEPWQGGGGGWVQGDNIFFRGGAFIAPGAWTGETEIKGGLLAEPVGGNAAHNNMQPYTTCGVLIKT